MKALLVAGACMSQLVVAGVGSALATSASDAPPENPHHVSRQSRPEIGLGPDVGFILKHASTSASYEPALVLGGHARLPLKPWLFARALGRSSEHAVTALGGDGEYELRAKFNELALALEPTWAFLPGSSISLGPYASWQYLKSREAQVSEAHVAERRGSQSEFGLSLGAHHEILRKWLMLQATVKSGVVASYSGDFFRDTQVITFSGFMNRLPGLPKVRTSHEFSFSLSFLL